MAAYTRNRSTLKLDSAKSHTRDGFAIGTNSFEINLAAYRQFFL
jgi:hypothetical protein